MWCVKGGLPSRLAGIRASYILLGLCLTFLISKTGIVMTPSPPRWLGGFQCSSWNNSWSTVSTLECLPIPPKKSTGCSRTLCQ